MIVSEDEIAEAMRLFIEGRHMLVEGAAALTLASLLKENDEMSGKNVVLVICGANVSLETLRDILHP